MTCSELVEDVAKGNLSPHGELFIGTLAARLLSAIALRSAGYALTKRRGTPADLMECLNETVGLEHDVQRTFLIADAHRECVANGGRFAFTQGDREALVAAVLKLERLVRSRLSDNG